MKYTSRVVEYKLGTSFAEVTISPFGETAWKYHFRFLDGSGYHFEWYTTLKRAKKEAVDYYNIKIGIDPCTLKVNHKYMRRAKWITL